METAPTENPVELKFDTAFWNSAVDRALTARTNFEQQWYMNMLFYRGKQWAVFTPSSMTQSGVALVNPKSSRKRLVFNRIMPTIRREFTKLTKEEPEFYVQPNTTEQSDVAAAKTGEAIAEFVHSTCHFNKAKRQAVWWATQTGTGHIKTCYNSKKSLPVGKGGKPVQGALEYKAPSTFHIVIPFLEVEDIEDQPWVVDQSTYDPSVVFQTYGIKVEPTAQISTSNMETRFRSAINIRQNNTTKQVLVRELWMKPTEQYPNGLYVVWSNETVLYRSEWPYDHKEFPYQKIVHIPSGGYYGYSTIEGLIPMQKEYNLTKSQMSEARDLTSKPALTAVKGSVDISKMKAVPGQIIEYMPGAEKPARLINPDMPNYILPMVDSLLADMDDNSAQYEVSKGRTPPGVEAASAIAYLQEENDTMLYHTVASLEDAVSKSGRQTLQLVQQYWDTTRIINTVGKTNVQGVIEFKGSDLKNNTDLRVVTDSMAPRSRAAKQASVLELIKLGIVDPDVALPYFQMSETNGMYKEMFIDKEQVQRENLRMARGETTTERPEYDDEGQPVLDQMGMPTVLKVFPANDFDDHQIHVMEHQKFQKSQEYELLSDEVKKIFVEHIKEHKAIFVAENLQNVHGSNAQPGIPGTGGDEPESGIPNGGPEPSQSIPV